MKIGVVSDTHGSVARTQPAIELFRQEAVERVIHCGDIGSSQIVTLFDFCEAHFVFGNVDHDRAELREAMKAAGHVCHERFGEVFWSGRKIAFLHGDDFRLLQETVAVNSFDLVCSGHTHEKLIEVVQDTKCLNPGALYRVIQPTVAIVDLETLEVRHLPVGSPSR